MVGDMFLSWMVWITGAKIQSHVTNVSVFDEQENAPISDSSSHLLSLCRSWSTSGESWWTRSRQPRTLGSARLWAPWRALPPLPPAPRPRPRPLQRRVLPRPSLSMSPAGCTLEPRNTSWRNKQQRNAVFLFFKLVAKQSSPGFLDCKQLKRWGKKQAGDWTSHLCFTWKFTFEWNQKWLLNFSGSQVTVNCQWSLIWFKAHRSMLILFCWVGSPNCHWKKAEWITTASLV